MSQEEFARILDRIVEDARDRSPVAIAGDFNAWALEWGNGDEEKRANALGSVLSAGPHTAQ